MTPDTMPWLFAVIGGTLAAFGYFVLELRASKAYWENSRASDPVVATGSGHRSNRGVRSCGGMR